MRFRALGIVLIEAQYHSTCEKYLNFEKQNMKQRNMGLPARKAHLMKIVSKWENL